MIPKERRGFTIPEEAGLHTGRRGTEPHVATEYIHSNPDLAEELSRFLREPYKARVSGQEAKRRRMLTSTLKEKSKQLKGK